MTTAKSSQPRYQAGARILGPDSLVWQLGSDWTVLLGGGRALILQVAHPTVAAGVDQHSDYREAPWKRLFGTLDLYLAIVFGGPDRAPKAGADLRSMHGRIKGTDFDGRPYHALDPQPFAWVHATLTDSSIEMIERFRRPLADWERERIYRENLELGRLYGLEPGDLPDDWAGFTAYRDRMVRERLRDSEVLRGVIASLERPPPPPGVRVPGAVWGAASRPAAELVRLVTIGTLPTALRERLGLPWSRRDELALRAAQQGIRRSFSLLPDRLRLMSPAYAGRRRERRRRAGGAGRRSDTKPSMGVSGPGSGA